MKQLVPQVAAIHDLSGFGRASLTVVIPILSSMGMQVCPLPTAVLSTHSGFDDYHFVDLTAHLQPIIDHWKKLDLTFDAIYSGFLGSTAQIDIVIDFIKTFSHPELLVVVDPVMGDDGALYGPLDISIVAEMRRLVAHADIITPNCTEVALLLDEPYREKIPKNQLKEVINRLHAMGPRTVIITSVLQDDPRKTAVVAHSVDDDRFWIVECDYIPASFPGTGDAFTSVIVGSLLQNDSLPVALDRAVHFTSLGIRAAFGHKGMAKNGILLERVLDTLKAPVQMSSYQLLD
ncbi:MAG: pyridoxamine kinase [Candidatus Cloacimonetes bacterium]|nr:pyridoxamine kinase [Candidatus Cloacimonadota bacterium]